MSLLKISVAISLINIFLLSSAVFYLSTKPVTKNPDTNMIVPSPTQTPPTPTANSKTTKVSTTPKPTPKNISPTKDPRCLIRVRGQIFDLTQFRNIHSGGNIFVCGTDMTTEFNGQHNDAIFRQLQQYAI